MTLELKVPNMACSACANTISKAIQRIDPSASIEADPQTKLVKIETVKSETAIRNAIGSAGYPAD
jgi:copper chaperone